MLYDLIDEIEMFVEEYALAVVLGVITLISIVGAIVIGGNN